MKPFFLVLSLVLFFISNSAQAQRLPPGGHQNHGGTGDSGSYKSWPQDSKMVVGEGASTSAVEDEYYGKVGAPEMVGGKAPKSANSNPPKKPAVTAASNKKAPTKKATPASTAKKSSSSSSKSKTVAKKPASTPSKSTASTKPGSSKSTAKKPAASSKSKSAKAPAATAAPSTATPAAK